MTFLNLIDDRHAEDICGGGKPPKPAPKPSGYSFSKTYDFDQTNTNTVTTTYTPGWASWSAFGNNIEVSQINAIGSMFG